jgi:hypothetical protein
MTASHALEKWLGTRGLDLRAVGIDSTLGRGPVVDGQPSATWISFEGAQAIGRATLWSSGRCQLTARSIVDGTNICRDEETVTTAAGLDAVLTTLTGRLVF